MTLEQELAFNAVQKINEELHLKYKSKEDFCPALCVVFSNSHTFISLSIPSYFELSIPEIPIYSSINDDRIYYEKSDKYESFYKFIKRKFKLIRTEIYNTRI